MFIGLVWLTNNHKFSSSNFWNKSPSWFLKTWELLLFYSGNFRIFKNALEQSISNHPPIHAALQIMVGHWQLPIIWEHWLAKKTWKLQKWPTTFHTHKKRILKLPNLKDLFFSNFIIQFHLNFFQNSDIEGTCIRHIRVWMMN